MASNEEPDFQHWAKLSYWNLDECTALSLARDPKVVNWNTVKAFTNVSEFASEFERRREIIVRAQATDQLSDATVPADFLYWAGRMQVSVPEKLADAVNVLGPQVRNWKSAYDEQATILENIEKKYKENLESQSEVSENYKKKLFELTEIHNKEIEGKDAKIKELEAMCSVAEEARKEKGLKTLERESLLKLTISMAINKYKYFPKLARSSVPKQIADDMVKLDLSLDDETILKYLRLGAELLPGDHFD